jgi:hypothetical protein
MAKDKHERGTETNAWVRYQRGVEHHRMLNMYENTAEAFRFYEGNQWEGIAVPGDYPVYNFITPTVRYKTNTVSQRKMSISYSAQDAGAATNTINEICSALDTFARTRWDAQKMDAKRIKVIRDACIAGDSYIYFYDKYLSAQIIDNTSIYFADEQQSDIQKQRYIIIYERRPVGDVKADAKKNKVAKDDIDLIVPDSDTDTVVGEVDTDAQRGDDGKCSCLLMLEKDEDGIVHIERSTRYVTYQPDTPINGLTKYPIASFVWSRKKNSARGLGEVVPLINNQIQENKLLYWRLKSAQQNAFAKPVYAENQIENPTDVTAVGAPIKIKTGNVQDVKNAFAYINPAPMSQEAGLLQLELLTKSRELAGAGDAALGNIDPERTSAAAIIALKGQTEIPLNEHFSADEEFVEQIAEIYLAMANAYYPNGLEVESQGEGGLIRVDTISGLADARLKVRIDAAQANPFSKLAQQQALDNALAAGYITFEEAVDAMSPDSTAPKAAFEKILKKRKLQVAPENGMGTVPPVGGMPASVPLPQNVPAPSAMTPQGAAAKSTVRNPSMGM